MRPHEVIVVVTGEFDGVSAHRWAALLADAVAIGPHRLVVDLTACARLDAAAIAELLRAHRDMVRGDGRLLLRRPAERVRRTLSLARVDHVLEVENLEEAR